MTPSFRASVTAGGDYAAVVVDPADDATFWIANETVLSGSSIWDTFIAKLDPVLPGPTPAPPTPLPEAGGLVLQDTMLEAACPGPAADVPNGLAGPTDLALSPDGLNVYGTAHSSEGSFVTTFRPDPATGLLINVQIIRGGSMGLQERLQELQRRGR